MQLPIIRGPTCLLYPSDYAWSLPFTSNADIIVTPTITSTYGFQVFNTNQCSVSGAITITVSTCTGITEIEALNAITIQPNPASTYFTLSNITEGTSIHLFEITGKAVALDLAINADKTAVSYTHLDVYKRQGKVKVKIS